MTRLSWGRSGRDGTRRRRRLILEKYCGYWTENDTSQSWNLKHRGNVRFEIFLIIRVWNKRCWKSKPHSRADSLPCDYHCEGCNSLMWRKPSIGKLRRWITQERLSHRTYHLPSCANPKAVIYQALNGHAQSGGHGPYQHCQSAPVLIDDEVTWKGKTYIYCLIHDWKGIDHRFAVAIETMDLFGHRLERYPSDLI